jgi:hypothetical protein
MSDTSGERPRPRHQAVRIESKSTGRRTFLKRLTGFGALGLGSAALGWWLGSKPKEEPPQKTSEAAAPPAKPIEAGETPKNPVDSLKLFANLDIDDPQRKAKEAEYAANAKTLDEIDKGFWATVDINARNELLNKRFALRQKGEEGLRPLDETRIAWAKQEGLHPEALAICEDAYSKAMKILDVLAQKKLIGDNPPLATRLISPGGLARITKFETSCFVFIGDTYSSRIFKGGDRESDKERAALQEIAHDLTKITGIDFDPNKIPSSYSGDIGFQFRPTSALDVKKALNNAGEQLNVFDLMSSTVGAYILLSQKGYMTMDGTSTQKALSGWNQKPEFAVEVLKANDSYNKTFRK